MDASGGGELGWLTSTHAWNAGSSSPLDADTSTVNSKSRLSSSTASRDVDVMVENRFGGFVWWRWLGSSCRSLPRSLLCCLSLTSPGRKRSRDRCGGQGQSIGSFIREFFPFFFFFSPSFLPKFHVGASGSAAAVMHYSAADGDWR